MRVVSEDALPVSSIVWQSSTRAFAFTAVCKLTFRLEPETAPLAEEQEAVNEEDNYWNDDESRSLVAPSDLAPFKPRADVVLVGSAFAADLRPVRSLMVRLCVGEIDKSIEARCDRWFEMDGTVREGTPFVKMPLRYERAAGGPDLSNPVGIAFDAPADGYGRRAIANLQPPGSFVQWRGDRFEPIGFGPIAPGWPGRMAKLHRHAGLWSHRGWNRQPLPADLDVSYFNVAPSDQQTERIYPGQRLVLEHLHPLHARLVTSLPGLAPRADVERASGHRETMALVADTLWIDTDRSLCTVTWRGRIGLVHPQEEGVVRIRVEGLDRRMPVQRMRREDAHPTSPQAVTLPLRPGAADIDETARVSTARAPMEAPSAPDATVTLVGGLEPIPGTALPFEASPWRTSPLAAPRADASGPNAADESGATLWIPPGAGTAAETLPFATPAHAITGRVSAAVSAATEALPFAPPTPRAAEPPAPPAAPPQRMFAPVEPAAVRPISPQLSSSSPSWPAAPAGEVDRTENAPLVAAEASSPAPPPMMGPLARPDMEPPRLESPPKVIEAEPPPAPALEPPPPPAAPEPDLQEYPVERCARIAVAVACRPADTAKILKEHELSEKGWEKVKHHWIEAMRKDLAKGKPGVRQRYDAAYVEQVEVERGPIGVSEYARLAVASERGTLGEVVAAMGLPSGAPMRIERVWIERMVRDAAFGAKVRDAVESARAE